MQSATAQLNTYRQSPRKVRLLADLVRGKKVDQAITVLRFANKRANGPFIKLIESAVSNAKNMGLNIDSLVVSGVTVNAGQTLKRSMPMSRGRAFRIGKRTSHIWVSLSEKVEKSDKAPKAEKTQEGTKKSTSKTKK